MGAPSTRRSLRGVRVPVLVVLLLCGCAASGTNGSGTASGASASARRTYIAGRLDALTSGRLFLRVIRFGQPPQSTFGSKKHQPGFIYQVSGHQVLALTGGPQVTLTSGEAYFHLSVPHTHLNPGPDPNSWLFLALWPSAARGQPNVNPLAYNSYDGPDFTPAPAAGPFSESLQLVSMEAGAIPRRRSGPVCRCSTCCPVLPPSTPGPDHNAGRGSRHLPPATHKSAGHRARLRHQLSRSDRHCRRRALRGQTFGLTAQPTRRIRSSPESST